MLRITVIPLAIFLMCGANAHANILLTELNPPYTKNELITIKKYLFSNISTKNNIFIKKNRSKTMYSLPGAVIASPSNFDTGFSMDYQIHWTRDAAISMNEVAYLYAHGTIEEKLKLKPYLINYINFEKIIQKNAIQAGSTALGEPKYNLDGSVWLDKWARPQNDGPALRALTLLFIAHSFLKEHQDNYVKMSLMPMIKLDLDYINTNWNKATYDLWEELNDREHFFTKIVQRKSLLEGSQFFKQLNNKKLADQYKQTANIITKSLERHWNEGRGYYVETIKHQHLKGGGMDSSILLGLIYGEVNDLNDPFALDNDKVISSIYFIRDGFKHLYKINIGHARHPLIGRYPNDIYDGNLFTYGNPWNLTTHLLAQYYYSLANILETKGLIHINQNNIYFFKKLDHRLKEGVIRKTSQSRLFNKIISSLVRLGDESLEMAKRYSVCYKDGTCNHLSEQVDRKSGRQVSAKDLTWGYATLLTAMQARDRLSNVK